jgi:hypothetical protein
MDTTRRGFLQLLGIGGAVAAVNPSGLFTSDVSLFGPEHYVFAPGTGARLASQGRASFLSKVEASRVSGDTVSVLHLRNPRRGRRPAPYLRRDEVVVSAPPPDDTWCPTGQAYTYQVNCPVAPGEDPHIAFYMAAGELQDTINADLAEFSRHLSQQSLAMVTHVDCPVMAFPHPEKGFYLETQITQFAAAPDDITNRDTAVSARGDIPVEAPDGVSFKYLMLMQEELLAAGMISDYRDRKALRHAFKKARSCQTGIRLS